jgi:hypothetical protein
MAPPKKPAKRRAHRAGARVRQRPEDFNWKGRRTDLTEELIAEICEAAELELSTVKLCKLLHLTPSVFYEWRAKGEEDLQAGRPTLYARMADSLSAATVIGEKECRTVIRQGLRVGMPGSKAKGGRAALTLKAADLALKVLVHKAAGKRGAEKRWGQRQGAEHSEQPTTSPQLDYSRLTQEDLEQYAQLAKEARESFATMALERVALLQRLTAKMQPPPGEST